MKKIERIRHEAINASNGNYLNGGKDDYVTGYIDCFECGKTEIALLNVKIEDLRRKLLESNDVLQQCAEALNLMASRAGICTEDAAPKSDAEDFGSLAALRTAREVLNQYKNI